MRQLLRLLPNYWNRFRQLRADQTEKDDPKLTYQLAYEGTLNDGCFDQRVFYNAFYPFDNQSIEESLSSDNPLVRVFALLDRRLGKRRLLAIESKTDQELPWVRTFYAIRMRAEGLEETRRIPKEGTKERSVMPCKYCGAISKEVCKGFLDNF